MDALIGIYLLARVLWNNDNIHTTQPKPVDFEVTDTGYTANLEDGSVMRGQKWIAGYDVLRTDLDNAFWWDDKYGNVVYGANNVGKEPMAETDLQAVSILMTMW